MPRPLPGPARRGEGLGPGRGGRTGQGAGPGDGPRLPGRGAGMRSGIDVVRGGRKDFEHTGLSYTGQRAVASRDRSSS